MFSTYKLNKQADNIQPWCTPFPILNQSIPCLVLTVFSWVAYRFLRRQVRWSGILISLRIFHSLLWSTQRLLCTQWSRSARSVAQSCLTLCDPMNRSMPGLPVHHQLPEFTQTKKCLISLIIREMKIKTTMRNHLTIFRIAIIKKCTNKLCWWRKGNLPTLLVKL